jgi:hypothetical protein
MDDSEVYTVIYYTKSGMVRCDIMNSDDEPVKSFTGFYSDVRKYVVRFMKQLYISEEHASYIGEQLALANLLKEAYIQD